MTPITTTSPPSSVTTTSSAFVDFLLVQFRIAGLRAPIIVNEIEAVTVALSAGLVDADVALATLHEAGLLPLIEASS
jgi:hypothetical protein